MRAVSRNDPLRSKKERCLVPDVGGQHAVETAADDRLIPLAAEKGVSVIVNRPFETGALFKSINNIQLPNWSKDWGITTWASFFLKYIISNQNLTCTIPATSQVTHLKENMAACFEPLPDAPTRKKMIAYFKANAL